MAKKKQRTVENEESTLVSEIEVGDSALVFLQSPIGKYVIGAIEQDLKLAKDALFEIDPYAYKDLVSLQNQIASLQRKGAIANLLQQYIHEAIVTGQQAEHVIDSSEEPE